MPEFGQFALIASRRNKEIVHITSLMKKSRQRYKEGLFIAEGKRLVSDLILRKNSIIRHIYICQGYDRTQIKGVTCPVSVVSRGLFESISDTKNPQGVFALCDMPVYQKEDVYRKDMPLILILEDVRDPGNLGTIFRSAQAGGCDGIILLGGCTDPYSPKSIRSSMGSTVHLPIIRYDDARQLNMDLIKYNIDVYAAQLGGTEYTEVDYCAPSAFIIGNEANGISEITSGLFKNHITIPMEGEVESLNAATTAAILTFEAARQRRKEKLIK